MRNKYIQWGLLLLILAVGIFVRVYDFGNTPYGLNQDEASLGYDAWADMNYGMDRNGDHNPIYAVAWGSGQNMLYNYVARPFIAVLGLSVVSVRLPMLIFCILSMVLFYLLVKRLFGDTPALIAAFILAICPWHIMASRWGLESNFAIPVAACALYCLARAKERGAWFIPGMVSLALLTYAYSCHMFFLVAFVPAICIYFLVKKTVATKWVWIGAGAFIVLSIPMILFLAVNQFHLQPIHFMGFAIPHMAELRSVGAAPILYTHDSMKMLSDNIIKFKEIITTMNDGQAQNEICHIGAIYKFMLPFSLVGLSVLFSKKNAAAFLILAWFFSGVMQALIINASIQRINILLFPLIILIALGIKWLFEKIKGSLYVVLIISLLGFLSFTGFYFTQYNDYAHLWFYGRFNETMKAAFDETPGTVYCISDMNMPYITALWVRKDDPAILKNAEFHYIGSEFRYIDRYDNFVAGVPVEIKAGDSYVYRTSDGLPENMPPVDLDRCYIVQRGNYSVIFVLE